jgi:hypothetical protein
MNRLLLILSCFFVISCATTNMKTYVDPEHIGKQYSKIIVDVPNAGFEFKALVIGKVCSGLQGKGVECIGKDDFLPPTREYSDDALFQLVEKNNIEGWLIISIGSGNTSSQYIGNQTFGSATAYGNTAYGNTNSIAMYSINRHQSYSITMYDMLTKQKAFIMEASTSAQGMANTTDAVFAGSLAEKILYEMSANKIIK